jgi:DivIVA domain-containing protein
VTYPGFPVDRAEIERTDFPAARRGYDVAAVREHLRRVADEVDALARRPAPSLAADASTRVQAIVEAAEASAQQLRDDAGREATAHVERVAEAARELLAKIERAHAELDRLLAGARASAESLTNLLDELRRDASAVGGRPVPPADEPAAAARAADVPAAAAAPAANGARSDDEAGARLVALNMALEGAPRDETGRYLAEHFELPDLDGLLDEVYASAGR